MRRKSFIIALAALGLLVAVGVITLLLINSHRHRLLRERIGMIQLAVERFAVDTEGAYPRSLDLLTQRGYLAQLPLNPYSGETMRVLEVTSAPAAGDIVYVPCGPIIAIGNATALTDPILPTEIDQYLLAAYGPLSAAELRAFPDRLRQWQQALGGITSTRYRAVIAGSPIYIPGHGGEQQSWLDYHELVPAWELFTVRLTAGEEGNAP